VNKLNITEQDIEKINLIINSHPTEFENGWSWTVRSSDKSKPMVINLYQKIENLKTGIMVSVQTRHGFYELHDINNILYFEPDEVLFLKSDESTMSCLIIGSENTCSLYSNININLIKSDFSQLHPAILLSAMQLSIAESLLN